MTQVSEINSEFLYKRGLKYHTDNKSRLMIVSHNDLKELNIEVVSELDDTAWANFNKDTPVFKRLIANHNMRQVCPFIINLEDLVAKDIPFPKKTTGLWYYFGSEIGFQNEKDKTWFIMENDLTNPHFVL